MPYLPRFGRQQFRAPAKDPGLGDLTPKTVLGKLFTEVYIFAGLGIIVGFIDTVAKETLVRQARRGGGEEDQEAGSAS